MNATRFLLLLPLLAAPAQAGAFDRATVPADAAWVVHVDVEACAKSVFLRALHADGIQLENEFDLDDLGRDFGLDPLADLRSLTFYGAGDRGEERVCVAVGTPALDAAWTRLAERGTTLLVAGGIDALQVQQRSSVAFLALLPGATARARVAVVAPSRETLEKGLLAVQGEAPTLARPDGHEAGRTPIAKEPVRGSLVFAVCAPVARAEETAAFLRRSLGLLSELAALTREEALAFGPGVRALDFDLGERGGELQIRLGVDAADRPAAKAMAQSLRAAAARTASEDDAGDVAQRVERLLESLRIETLGARLEARFGHASARLVEDIGVIERARGVRPAR